jgi:NAD(P)H-dependent FMN reductase
MPNLIALAASFRTHSLNKRLLDITIGLGERAGATIHALDYTACETPLYREEAEGDALPSGAKYFADALLKSDGLLLASPEYNWSIPGALKNLIDWLSVDPRAPLKGKTALLLCASPSVRGGIIGLQQLRVPLEHLGMIVYPHVIGIGKAESQFIASGLAGNKEQRFLEECVTDFVRITKAIHA